MMRKINKQSVYTVLLVTGLPLLMLGGCASNDTMKLAVDTSLANETGSAIQANDLLNEQSGIEADMMTDAALDNTDNAVELAVIDGESAADQSSIPGNEVVDSIKEVAKPQEGIVGFGFDESNIDSQYGELLWQHAQYLKANSNLILHVSGHTDASGAKSYNQMLSKKRANEVANVLLEFGAPKDRVKIIAIASDQPLSGAIHHREHRRVELDYQDQQIVSN